MGQKKVFDEDIGRFFRELRERRRVGLRQAVRRAEILVEDGQKHLDVITVDTLGRLERGKTKHVDRDLLWALATLYKIPYKELLSAYVRQKYLAGLDDFSHVAVTELASNVAATSRGTITDEAATRLLEELGSTNDLFHAAIADIAKKLGDQLADSSDTIAHQSHRARPSRRVRGR